MKKTKQLLISHLILSLITSFSLTSGMISCAFNKDANGNTDQDRLDADRSQKIRAEYDEAKGLYEGILKTPAGNQPVALRLYLFEATGGQSSSGKVKSAPVLRGNFTLTESLNEYPELAATYDRESGEITLSPDSASSAAKGNTGNSGSSGSATGGIKKTISIRGQIRGGKFTGEATEEGGILGQLLLDLKDKNATALSDQERNDRILNIFNRVAGVYSTVIITPTFTEIIDLVLKVNKATTPYSLSAECMSSYGGIELMQISYEPFPNPGHIYISPLPQTNPSGASKPFCYFSGLETTITPEGLAGTMQSRRGSSGPILLRTKRLNDGKQ